MTLPAQHSALIFGAENSPLSIYRPIKSLHLASRLFKCSATSPPLPDEEEP